jgi:hypothetical protein
MIARASVSKQPLRAGRRRAATDDGTITNPNGNSATNHTDTNVDEETTGRIERCGRSQPLCGCHSPAQHSPLGWVRWCGWDRFVEEVFEVADGHGFGEVRVEPGL